ncbi:hypothetical protein B5F10_14270 [Anaerotruncus colihominis]|uniref:Uncharacterized protein n=1 Tax=Anaerotruncus colihominis TaxID=169435 RepID=A0A1Y4MM49_9FIRM|nr:hypothetical protein B5F11_10035 [Anaerotruncus colihominis]OUP72639.1 hypothetical protein B5F10_14270 [Anaerotruncus colihominis]
MLDKRGVFTRSRQISGGFQAFLTQSRRKIFRLDMRFDPLVQLLSAEQGQKTCLNGSLRL